MVQQRNESEQLIEASEYARKAWYEGGMWRGPNVLPGAAGQHAVKSSYGSSDNNSDDDVGDGGRAEVESTKMGMNGPSLVPRAPVSLSDLFLDLVTVTAFSRIGAAIQVSENTNWFFFNRHRAPHHYSVRPC